MRITADAQFVKWAITHTHRTPAGKYKYVRRRYGGQQYRAAAWLRGFALFVAVLVRVVERDGYDGTVSRQSCIEVIDV